uniref:Uncharacterized protein n=1 Tax=Clandestinovirus TaxID=2831644 RepID=A0A8F8KRL4_9VIRU|nr:hypothetical protein KOM_12_606 [Clandestinovirus]
MDLLSLKTEQLAKLTPAQCDTIHEAVRDCKFSPITVKTLADLEKIMDQQVTVEFFGAPQTLPLKRAYNLLKLTAGEETPKPKPKPTTAKPASVSVSVSLGSSKVGTKRPAPAPSANSDTPTPAAKKQRTEPPKSPRVSSNPKPTSTSTSKTSTVVAPAGSPTKQDTKVASVEYGRRMFNSTPPEPMKPTIEGKYYFKNFASNGDRASDLKEFGKHGSTHLFYEKIFPAKPTLVHFSKDCKICIRPNAVRGNPNLKSELLGRVENTTYVLQPISKFTKELTNPSSIWCNEMVEALGSYTSMKPNPSKNGWDMAIYYPEAFLAEVTPDVAQLLRSAGVAPKKYFRMPAGFSFGAGRELLIHLYKKNADVFKKLNDEYGTDGPQSVSSRTSQVSQSRSSYASNSSSSSASSSNEEDDVIEIKKPSDFKNVPAAQRDRNVSTQPRPKTITLPNTRVNNNTNVPAKSSPLSRSNSIGQGMGAQSFRRVKEPMPVDDLEPVPDQSELDAADDIIEREMEEARLREEQEALQNGHKYHFSANGTELEAM